MFAFDYDLTFMVFFLSAEGEVYARYGGRDARDADNRQSLAGLRYTMQSVLDEHARAAKEFAPKSGDSPKFVRDLAGGVRVRGCVHCHQVKEALNAGLRKAGTWTADDIWRFPPPENVGFRLEVDRGNVVEEVKERSAAAVVGLRPGDVVRRLNGVSIHSYGDAQFALDRAPKAGKVEVVWRRGGEDHKGGLALAEGWRRTDILWRPSMQEYVADARLSGTDLTAEEKKTLGLSEKQLAFREKDGVSRQAEAAGVRAGDVILGVDDKAPETDADGFFRYVRHNYVVGDRVTVNLIRDGKRLNLPMTLLR